MENITLKIIIRRFLELFLTNAVISAILTLLNITMILTMKNALLFGMIIGLIVFLTANFIMLRHCYFDLRDDYMYYKANIAAQLLFALFGIIAYILLPSVAYTLIFALTKFMKYTFLNLSAPFSAALFFIIGFSVIFLAPIGMGWIYETDDVLDDE